MRGARKNCVICAVDGGSHTQKFGFFILNSHVYGQLGKAVWQSGYEDNLQRSEAWFFVFPVTFVFLVSADPEIQWSSCFSLSVTVKPFLVSMSQLKSPFLPN